MGIEKVKFLLSELQNELKDPSIEVDETTRLQIQEMDVKIHKLLNQNNQQDNIYDELVKMEYEFLNNHPVASNMMREIVSLLSRAGI
jgi:hypothetical protein